MSEEQRAFAGWVGNRGDFLGEIGWRVGCWKGWVGGFGGLILVGGRAKGGERLRGVEREVRLRGSDRRLMGWDCVTVLP